tara:strand:+ start:34 stop:192 length:159 start_codon:yes stop_codon:yes gene_type:complete
MFNTEEKKLLTKSMVHYQNYLRSNLKMLPKEVTEEEYYRISEIVRNLLQKLK